MCPEDLVGQGQAEDATAAWDYNLTQWSHVLQPHLLHGTEGLRSLAQVGADGGVEMNLRHLVRCSDHSGFPERSWVPT
jgi:hypothetical protein